MRDDKIIAAWNRMNPNSSTKEEIFHRIQDTIETHQKNNFTRMFRRFAIGAAAAVIVLFGSFGTAYAASPAFREYVHTLLFPLYTSDEMVSIDNGHMTGSFDQSDVLLSFLDKFNRQEFGNSITAAEENGYQYSLYGQNEDQLRAFVDSSIEGYCIVVYLERITYKDTEGIWQVTSYQVLEKSIAENVKDQLEPYSDKQAEEIISIPQEDTAITGVENSVIIYNVNEKKNVVSINEDDSAVVSDILNACEKSAAITGGLFQYVIKIGDTSYLFDAKGNGLVDESGNRSGITIPESDLRALMALFERYDISLEEIR